MRLTLVFLLIPLFYNGCVSVNTEELGKPSIETNIQNTYDYRWVDNSDVIELLDFSLDLDIVNYKDVFNKLGEPVYSEKIFLEDDNGKKINSLIFWYKYKSRIYPVLEQVTTTTKRPYEDSFGNPMIQTKTVVDEFEQIKPDKSLDHEKWEPGTKWLVVIMFDNTFELLMTDDLGTSYSINRENYNLSNAGFFENNRTQVDFEDLKSLIKKTVNELEQ